MGKWPQGGVCKSDIRVAVFNHNMAVGNIEDDCSRGSVYVGSASDSQRDPPEMSRPPDMIAKVVWTGQ
jgi:hypothetical protein